MGGLFYNSGSAALALASVAAGRLVGFYESDLRAWDALAGEVLIRESGGWSTEFMRDGSLTTSKPVLAANRGSASALWDIVGETLKDCEPPEPGQRT
jgi:myo-inositol-1(or 4)-monophosphatase